MWTVGGRNKRQKKKKKQFFGKVFAIEKLMETASADADQIYFCSITANNSPEAGSGPAKWQMLQFPQLF